MMMSSPVEAELVTFADHNGGSFDVAFSSGMRVGILFGVVLIIGFAAGLLVGWLAFRPQGESTSATSTAEPPDEAAAAEEDTSEMTANELLTTLTCDEIRALLKKRAAPTSGVKPDIIQRMLRLTREKRR